MCVSVCLRVASDSAAHAHYRRHVLKYTQTYTNTHSVPSKNVLYSALRYASPDTLDIVHQLLAAGAPLMDAHTELALVAESFRTLRDDCTAIALALIGHGANPNMIVHNETVLDRLLANAPYHAEETPAMIRFLDALVSVGARTNQRPLSALLSNSSRTTALGPLIEHLVLWHNADPQVRASAWLCLYVCVREDVMMRLFVWLLVC